MANALLSVIISIFFYIISFIGSVIFYPAQLLIFAAFPSFGEYAVDVVNYIVQEVFPLVTWIKSCLIHITTIPEGFWLLIIGQIFTLYGMAITVRIYALLVKLYRFIKTAGS